MYRSQLLYEGEIVKGQSKRDLNSEYLFYSNICTEINYDIKKDF